MVMNIQKRIGMRTQLHRRARRSRRHQPHIHHIPGTQTQRLHHPMRQKRVILRTSKIQRPPDDPRQILGRRMKFIERDLHPRRRDALHSRHLEQPRHFRFGFGDGLPEIPTQAHLISGLYVVVAEDADGGVESIVEGEDDAAAVGEGVGQGGGGGDVFGVVVFDGLFEEGEGVSLNPFG
mmetsp:Transcript_11481/g.24378  ORF Transcript_11481/g.24378 Transcript_11481/m.24378 type:complete len:179 (+) Transcript_11481:437-973(+)